MKLSLNKSVIWFQSNDGVIITGIEDDKVYKLNDISSEIFNFIVNDNDFNNIINSLCIKYGEENRNLISNDVIEFINDMKLLKVLEE